MSHATAQGAAARVAAAAAPRAARQAYRDLLAELLPADDRLVCIDTDTGLFTGVDFGTASARYVNLGIAEHNLMGVAAGMAAAGKQPFVNTMAAFAASRALEAVKIDSAYNALPVRIVATHGGLSAGHLGPTHHALEDLAVMRALPNLTVVVPADAGAAEAAVRQAIELPGPVYLRLGRNATPAVAPGAEPPVLGRAQVLREGGDAAVIACGSYPLLAALAAADELAGLGIGVRVVNLHTLKPLDTDALVATAEQVPLVVTVEEHWRAGGLGAAVAETLSETVPTRMVRLGMPDTFVPAAGAHEDLLAAHGITAEAITAAVLIGPAGRHRSPPSGVGTRPAGSRNGANTGAKTNGGNHDPAMPRMLQRRQAP